MSNLLNMKTISPFSSPLNLVLGIDLLNKTHNCFLQRLAKSNERFINIHRDKQRKDYDDIGVDTRDIRLLLWSPKDAPELKIHVFPNGVAVAEFDVQIEQALNEKVMAKQCNELTEAILEKHFELFKQDLLQVATFEDNKLLSFNADVESLDVYWTARTMMLSSSQLKQDGIGTLLKTWLKDTQRPEDADDILAGRKDYSLTWLNYAVVENKQSIEDEQDVEDPRISTMILAQYYYCAQENCNKMLKQAIDNAYNGGDVSVTEKQLAESRVTTRVHQIDFHEHLKYMKRFKRKLIHDILSSWDFEQMVENGQRMIEVCSSRLQEVDNKRRERSTIMTDLLLVTLSFFAVFELSLYLTEFSREMMSRPALDYHDDGRSFLR